MFTAGLWSNEPLSSKIKSAKCLSLSNPRTIENNPLYGLYTVYIFLLTTGCVGGGSLQKPLSLLKIKFQCQQHIIIIINTIIVYPGTL